MIRIGIAGQHGFIGQHLYNTLGLFPDEFERVTFRRDFFQDQNKLIDFVKQCDVIVHLAGMNRHDDQEFLYKENIDLTVKLVNALDASGETPHILFSSSSQETNDNPYGRSKREGREILLDWSERTGGKFTGMLIPNVFGPFGKPYYNSFIATFCYQLTHNEQPRVDIDGQVKLINIADLVFIILSQIRTGSGNKLLIVPNTDEYKVSEILTRLKSFKEQYYQNGIIPVLESKFEVDLFNTFRSYIDIENHYPVKLVKHSDSRGIFVEIIRLNIGGQISFSTTAPGITRGNHFHTRKIERFAVIKGKALIQLRKIGSDEVIDLFLDGNDPAYVDMPVWYTHNIKNIGTEELYTNFWINEFYDPFDADTYIEEV